MMRDLAGPVLALDPRLKIAAGITLGLAASFSGIIGLLCMATCLGSLIPGLKQNRSLPQGMLKGMAVFLLLWVGLKLAADVVSGLGVWEASAGAGLLGGRLFVLLLLGLVLTLACPMDEMGAALHWALRPLCGQRAWQAALAVALMVHALPLCGRVMAEVRQGMAVRGGRLGLWRRMAVWPTAVVRIMACKTWDQSLAVASRRLDDTRAWIRHFPPFGRRTLTAVVVVALFCLLALI